MKDKMMTLPSRIVTKENELSMADAEIERLQKDRSRSENELDRLREWVAAVEDGYNKQKTEIERLRDQRDTYAEMVEQLTRQLDAAAVLLRRPDRVEWGYDVEKNAMAYFLDGKLAGPTIRHAIRMAAKEG
jgi:chromosome segregation ATPase